MTDPNETITRLVKAYVAAVRDRDLDAFMRLYDPQVRVFDAWGVWSYEGASDWRKPIVEWFASHPTERIEVTFEDVKTWGEQGTCVLSAFISYASISAEGKQLRAMQNRITWAVAGMGDAARIVHEHTSAPIAFDDMKAMLVHPTFVAQV